MTGPEYERAITRLGMTPVEAARFLGVDDTTSRRWMKDMRPVPHPVALLLRVMIKYRLTANLVTMTNSTR